MKKKYIIYVAIVLVIIIAGLFCIFRNKSITDGEKFSNEYATVNKDNIFKYRTIDEIIKILENGTGVVYLGFPECPWCLEYVKYVNEIGSKCKDREVYYFNILNDRKNNTEEYKKLLKILDNYLEYDKEGNKKIFVPCLIAVNEGKIVGYDNETAHDTKGYKTPKEYWENEDLNALKNKISKMFDNTCVTYCTSGCNK